MRLRIIMMYFLAGLAQIPVVLLVAAVKFQELIVILRKMIGGLASAIVAAMVPASVGMAALMSSLCVSLTGGFSAHKRIDSIPCGEPLFKPGLKSVINP
jgi:hypothetical protein